MSEYIHEGLLSKGFSEDNLTIYPTTDSAHSDIKNILDTIVNEIFNKEIQFYQTSKTERCTFCSFKDLCERSSKDRN